MRQITLNQIIIIYFLMFIICKLHHIWFCAKQIKEKKKKRQSYQYESIPDTLLWTYIADDKLITLTNVIKALCKSYKKIPPSLPTTERFNHVFCQHSVHSQYNTVLESNCWVLISGSQNSTPLINKPKKLFLKIHPTNVNSNHTSHSPSWKCKKKK